MEKNQALKAKSARSYRSTQPSYLQYHLQSGTTQGSRFTQEMKENTLNQEEDIEFEGWEDYDSHPLKFLRWFFLPVVEKAPLEGLNLTSKSFSSCPTAQQKSPPSIFQPSLMLQASLFWLQLLWDRLNNVITRHSTVAPCIAKTRHCSGHANLYHGKTPANQVVKKEKKKNNHFLHVFPFFILER